MIDSRSRENNSSVEITERTHSLRGLTLNSVMNGAMTGMRDMC